MTKNNTPALALGDDTEDYPSLSEVLQRVDAEDPPQAEPIPPTLSDIFDAFSKVLDVLDKCAIYSDRIAGRLDGAEETPLPQRPAEFAGLIDQLYSNVSYAEDLSAFMAKALLRASGRLG